MSRRFRIISDQQTFQSMAIGSSHKQIVSLKDLSHELYRKCDIYEIVKKDEKFLGSITNNTIRPINEMLAKRAISQGIMRKWDKDRMESLRRFNDSMLEPIVSNLHSYVSLNSTLDGIEKNKEQELIRQSIEIVKYLESGKWLFYLEGE